MGIDEGKAPNDYATFAGPSRNQRTQSRKDLARTAHDRQAAELAKFTPSTRSLPCEVVDLTSDEQVNHKRKRDDPIRPGLEEYCSAPSMTLSPPKKAKVDTKGEKRSRRWRSKPPLSYEQIRERALTQRMFALDRQRDTADPDRPFETVTLAGTTGNIYTVTIDHEPKCDCPHARKGNQCKHICYVLTRILRVRSDLEYQLAFTASELQEIFARAPPLPSQTSKNKNGNRKPIDGECPICVVDFEPESREEIVYCKAACGNNIHKSCFEQWAKSKRGAAVPCPFCRTPWKSSNGDIADWTHSARVTAEGYLNVAGQLGISGIRDHSTYHSYWVRRQVDRGVWN